MPLIKKKTYIVSTYTSYEWITTRDTYSLLLLKFKYMRDGYRVFAFPTMKMARLWYVLTGKGIYKGTNVRFERYVPGTGQITYHTPYHNFY